MSNDFPILAGFVVAASTPADNRPGPGVAPALLSASAETRRKADWRKKNPEKVRASSQRTRAANPEKLRAYTRQWREDNPEKVRAKKRKERDANYFRRFVAIDSEGQNYPGDDDAMNSEPSGVVRYEKHETYLWGAAADGGREPEWLTAPATDGADKKPLAIYQILDWLISLPEKFGDVVFVSFAFGYDATQILKSLPYAKAWEIFKRETYSPVKSERRAIGGNPVFWDEYAFSYIKGKWLEIKHLRDRDNPYKMREDGQYILSKKGKRQGDYDKSIKIFDTFGFFQQGFAKVVDSMTASGRASPEEAAFLSAMKKGRDDPEAWAARDVGEIKRYTSLELRLLARMMADIRKGFNEMDRIRLRGWHGPGAAASAFLEGRNIKQKHFPTDIAARDIPAWQEAAHHAFFGGHIEMLKQGYVESTPLHVYDIASAYPAAIVEFPGMTGGNWERSGNIDFHSLAALRALVEKTSIFSMFKIMYLFPEYEKYHSDDGAAVIIPFYPLPYRRKGGGILYPARGYGWYMRDDVLTMIAWLERFVPDYPRRRKKEHKETAIIIEEAWFFHSETDGRPFSIVGDFYKERKRIKQENKYDIREKTIKLTINSIYGQFARAVGDAGKVPPAANPYYAAATTAYTRRRVMEAALIDPHAIVFFATDGIVSTRELVDLARLRKPGENVDLGDWEYCEANRGLFIMAGVYTYDKVSIGNDGSRVVSPVSKLRGANPKNYIKNAEMSDWIIRETLEIWRSSYSTQGKNPVLSHPYKKYITVGNALASRQRWKLAGRWSPPATDAANAAYRQISVADPGGKRLLLNFEPDWLSTPESPANRCASLIRTRAAWNDDDSLSRPRTPDWIDEDAGNVVKDAEEQAEIAAGFE